MIHEIVQQRVNITENYQQPHLQLQYDSNNMLIHKKIVSTIL
jgi:hypothetical protein